MAPETEPLFKDRPTFAESPFAPESPAAKTPGTELPATADVANPANSATSPPASSASPAPPARTAKSRESTYTLVEQAPVSQGLWVAAILILFSGVGVFMVHKSAYDSTVGVFKEGLQDAFREQEWTEEELAKLPPELRRIIEAQAAEAGGYDEDYDSEEFDGGDFEGDDQDWDGE